MKDRDLSISYLEHLYIVNLKTSVSRKQSTSNFPENEHFLRPDSTRTFFGKLGVPFFP